MNALIGMVFGVVSAAMVGVGVRAAYLIHLEREMSVQSFRFQDGRMVRVGRMVRGVQ